MALLLTHAALHTVGNDADHCCYSNMEMEVDSETCIEFVGKHVRRLLRGPDAKEATFHADSAVYALMKGYQKREFPFMEMSRQICRRLAGIMEGNDDIPPSDILVAAFENNGKSYIAIIKLNYDECFTHRQVEESGATRNQIVKNTAVLPLSAGKVEEACLIPYDPMVLRITEKTHMVGGESVHYFSRLFLECDTGMSQKEIAATIRELADEITAEYFAGGIEMAATIKSVLLHEAEEAGEDGLVLENVVNRAFGEHNNAKEKFVSLAQEQGLPHQLVLNSSFVQKEFKSQQFKADNGIEIKCPVELFQDPGQVQIVTNPDGSITITLRNLRPKES